MEDQHNIVMGSLADPVKQQTLRSEILKDVKDDARYKNIGWTEYDIEEDRLRIGFGWEGQDYVVCLSDASSMDEELLVLTGQAEVLAIIDPY